MQSRGADYGEDEYVSVIPSSDVEAQVRVTCPDKTGLGSDITRTCLLYTSPSPRDQRGSRMPSSA